MATNEDIVKILSHIFPQEISKDLVNYFLQIRKEIQTCELEKSTVGKFVETVVQLLQSLDTHRCGKYDKSVKDVDGQLRNVYESREISNLPNDSRIAIVRIARAIYCLRSKRGIIHKNEIDPNIFDLQFIYAATQWILTELIRIAADIPIKESKKLVEHVQKPVIPIIETILGRPLVLDDSLTTKEEILLVLYERYDKEETVSRSELGKAMDRKSASSVSKALRELWDERLIEGNSKDGYQLTLLGVKKAQSIIKTITERESLDEQP
ncbi:MAG TPA: hypothetical protein ENG73_03150 [Desulfobacterales bacterium]|nr:hypothetical protein [Desulfobacterales bacterium]